MQTFLPSSDFDYCARVLDRMRLGSQRRETVQLIYANTSDIAVGTPELLAKKAAIFERGEVPKRGWSNHPAARMWYGRLPALLVYLQAMNREWIRRGYNSNLVIPEPGSVTMPSWLGDPALHASHRSNLIRKDPAHYGTWGWSEPPDLEYVWPGPCANLTTPETVSP